MCFLFSKNSKPWWRLKVVAKSKKSYQIEVKNIPLLNLSNFMKMRGVHYQLTIVYTPKQNGVSKRNNKTIMEMA